MLSKLVGNIINIRSTKQRVQTIATRYNNGIENFKTKDLVLNTKSIESSLATNSYDGFKLCKRLQNKLAFHLQTVNQTSGS